MAERFMVLLFFTEMISVKNLDLTFSEKLATSFHKIYPRRSQWTPSVGAFSGRRQGSLSGGRQMCVQSVGAVCGRSLWALSVGSVNGRRIYATLLITGSWSVRRVFFKWLSQVVCDVV